MPSKGDETLREVDPSRDGAWLRKVYELGKAFAARPELDELIPFVLAKCREVLNADGVAVLFIEPERNELYFPFVSEDDPEVAKRLGGLRFPVERGIAGAVLRSGRAEKIDDARSDPRFYVEVDRRTGTLVGASGFRPYDVSFLRCLALKFSSAWISVILGQRQTRKISNGGSDLVNCLMR